MDVMPLLVWMIIGAFAGWLGERIMHPFDDTQELLLYHLLGGMFGGLGGGFLFTIAVPPEPKDWDFIFGSTLLAFFGAVLLVGIMQIFLDTPLPSASGDQISTPAPQGRELTEQEIKDFLYTIDEQLAAGQISEAKHTELSDRWNARLSESQEA